MYDVRQIVADVENGVAQMAKADPAFLKAFGAYQDESVKEGALSTKTKELIGVAIGAYNRCQYCICVHVQNAYKAGATRQEILEAAMTAIGFGGGPSMAYSATVLMDAVNEFEKDFQ